jgi:hypothetical protein
MTPQDLAAVHPRLFHVTAPGAWPSIATHGLLPAASVLDLFEVPAAQRAGLTRRRRPVEVPLDHPLHGRAVLNDNLPLSEAALAGCLDDGLQPRDWLAMLNARVFFWADEAGLARLLAARMNRGRARAVLVVDTLGLATAHAARVEICPINSGSTIRRPARRGLATFTPLGAMGYAEWRRRRGGRDRILEVTVVGGVPDIARHVIERRETNGA